MAQRRNRPISGAALVPNFVRTPSIASHASPCGVRVRSDAHRRDSRDASFTTSTESLSGSADAQSALTLACDEPIMLGGAERPQITPPPQITTDFSLLPATALARIARHYDLEVMSPVGRRGGARAHRRRLAPLRRLRRRRGRGARGLLANERELGKLAEGPQRARASAAGARGSEAAAARSGEARAARRAAAARAPRRRGRRRRGRRARRRRGAGRAAAAAARPTAT